MWSLNRGGYGAIIDVHSGSVGIAIIDLRKESAKPIFAYREHLKIGSSGEDDTRALKTALLAASLEYSKKGQRALRAHDPRGRVEQVLFVYGAPWARVATRFIKVEDPVPFIVSKERIEDLVAEAEAKDELEGGQRAELEKLKAAIIERSVVHTALNGYLTTEPYGKSANELSLAHISGLVPQDVLKLTLEVEDKLMPHAERHTHTFALTLFCVVRDLYPKVGHGLLVNISAEATEIIVMQDEILIESIVIPYGAHTFLRQVAKDLKTMPEEAIMHLREYSDESRAAVKKAVKSATEDYTAILNEALEKLQTKYVLPHTVFLLVNKDLDIFFKDMMEKVMEPYYKVHGAFHSLNEALQEIENQRTEKPYDAFFGIESRFFHKRHICGEGTFE